MNARAVVPLIAGLIILGVGAKLGLDYVKKAKGAPSPMVKLWAPNEDIARGTRIDETMVHPVQFPKASIPAGAIFEVKNLVGRVPHTGAPAGLPILESMLHPKGTPGGIFVPPGFRAVPTRITDSAGLDQILQPGDHVDVVGSFSTGGRANRTVARTILEDVEVAAVGDQVAPDNPNETDNKSSGSRRKKAARAAVLLLKPQDVPTLHVAEQRGKIKLTIRSRHNDATLAGNDLTDSDAVITGKSSAPENSESLLGFVKGLFGSETTDEPVVESAPVVEVPVPVAVKTEPKYAHTMVIYNGDEKRVLAWAPGHLRQAVELTTEGPNIFRDDPPLNPEPPKSTRPPDSNPQAPPLFEPPVEETSNVKESSSDSTDEN